MIRREYQQKVAALALEAISPMGTPRNVVGTRTPQPTPPATPRAAKNTGSNLAISNIAGSNSINASSSSTRPMQELSSPKSARSMLSRRSPSTSPNRPRRDQAPQKTFLDEMQDERQRQADAQGTAMALRQLMPDQAKPQTAMQQVGSVETPAFGIDTPAFGGVSNIGSVTGSVIASPMARGSFSALGSVAASPFAIYSPLNPVNENGMVISDAHDDDIRPIIDQMEKEQQQRLHDIKQGWSDGGTVGSTLSTNSWQNSTNDESAITDNGRRDSEPVAIYDDELNQVVMFESVKHSKLAAPVQAPALARSSEPTSEPPSVRRPSKTELKVGQAVLYYSKSKNGYEDATVVGWENGLIIDKRNTGCRARVEFGDILLPQSQSARILCVLQDWSDSSFEEVPSRPMTPPLPQVCVQGSGTIVRHDMSSDSDSEGGLFAS